MNKPKLQMPALKVPVEKVKTAEPKVRAILVYVIAGLMLFCAIQKGNLAECCGFLEGITGAVEAEPE